MAKSNRWDNRPIFDIPYPTWDVQEHKYFWLAQSGDLLLGTAEDWENDIRRRFENEIAFMRASMDATQIMWGNK